MTGGTQMPVRTPVKERCLASGFLLGKRRLPRNIGVLHSGTQFNKIRLQKRVVLRTNFRKKEFRSQTGGYLHTNSIKPAVCSQKGGVLRTNLRNNVFCSQTRGVLQTELRWRPNLLPCHLEGALAVLSDGGGPVVPGAVFSVIPRAIGMKGSRDAASHRQSRRLKLKRCGEHAQRALLALDCCLITGAKL